MSGGYIYRITNTKNGKVYIGSSKDYSKRWKRHIADLRTGNHHSIHLQRAYDKHGESAFEFEVIERCMPDEMEDREQWHMDNENAYEYVTGYNISKKAQYPFVGIGEESWSYGRVGEQNGRSVKVAQLSMDNRLIKVFDSANLAQKEIGVDASTIIKICKGKLNSISGFRWAYLDDYKNGKHLKNKHNFRKAVVKLSQQGQPLVTYESINEAGRVENANYKNIHSCCKGIRKKAAGYKWMYLEEYENGKPEQISIS